MEQAEADQIVCSATNSRNTVRSKQIGNGEYIVIIEYKRFDRYIWCREEWEKFSPAILLPPTEIEAK